MKKPLLVLTGAAAALLPRLASAQVTIPRPLGDLTLQQIIGNLVKALLGISGTLALIMIIIGGLRWMTAQGDPEAIKKAKSTLEWAILGLIVAFSSFTLVDFILRAL
jgi:type IV secretory pathway VirB2 component (pilin)